MIFSKVDWLKAKPPTSYNLPPSTSTTPAEAVMLAFWLARLMLIKKLIFYVLQPKEPLWSVSENILAGFVSHLNKWISHTSNATALWFSNQHCFVVEGLERVQAKGSHLLIWLDPDWAQKAHAQADLGPDGRRVQDTFVYNQCNDTDLNI